MKKIILFDDNSKNQREVYDASFVDKNDFDDCLIHIEKVNGQTDFSFIKSSLYVFMHDSLEDYVNGEYVEGGRDARNIIMGLLEQYDIPYVLFSDGHPQDAVWAESNPNYIYQIKKSVFYGNLKAFLNSYRNTGKADIRIIAFGENFKVNLIKQWGQIVIKNISSINDNDYIDSTVFDRKCLRNIIEYAQPAINTTYEDIMDNIIDHNITAGKLKQNINNITSDFIQYGENFSSWE